MPRKVTTEEFTIKANKVHPNTYDYTETVYIKARDKVIIICKEHGPFKITPNNHLNGKGCPKCGVISSANKQRSNTEEFTIKANKVHNNKYIYTKTVYINRRIEVIIICKEHGPFKITPASHLRGCGCSKCGVISTANKLRSNTEEFIEKANEVHPNTYDYTETVYINARDKVIIICKEHGQFEQTPDNHLSGSGCPKCVGKNKTTEEFIEEANKVHPNTYDYPENIIYVNNRTYITIICKEHGPFKITPNNHLRGSGCPKCAGKNRTTEEFIEKANKVHPNTYDYRETVYINARDKVIIICKEHGPFGQTPDTHLSGSGCPKCGVISTANKLRSNTEEFIEKANKVHDNTYDYTETVYINAHDKVIIICKEHGMFKKTPNDHLRGSGCPGCNNRGYSRTQIEWLNFISKRDGITIIHAENEGEFSIPNTKFKADGYCVETNTVYEFHGDYWHGNPKVFDSNEFNKTTKCTFGELYQKTLDKEQQIKDMGFNLVTMWENDWDELNNCVIMLQRIYRNSKRTHKPT
jgi:predicted nucleic-acid-binding Zn-ribbon protein